MNTKRTHWDLTILDALPGECTELHSLLVVDLFQNGSSYIFTGGKEGMFWYHPSTKEKGVISRRGCYHVGLAAADLNKDGVLELYAAEQDVITGVFKIVCFMPLSDLQQPWKKVVIDDYCTGNPHDIAFFDIDQDGELEMIAVSAYTKTPGLYLYKLSEFPKMKKYQISQGHLTEGIKVADLDEDGRLEIVSGPDYYHMPVDGCYGGEWVRKTYAKNFREMCRIDVVDVTGNGVPDIVIVESEYRDGQFSWFENRLNEKENCFVEHRIADCFVFAHSLQAIQTDIGVEVMLAEMCEGGWSQPYNSDARIMNYSTKDNGGTWADETLYYGQGTHQGILYDIDADGVLEIVSKTWQHPMVHILKKNVCNNALLDFSHEFIDRDKSFMATDIFGAKISNANYDDVVCGHWWYVMPHYEKHELPEIHQAICAFDVDHDGVVEIIGTRKRANHKKEHAYGALGSELVCIKPVDPLNDIWQVYDIGVGSGWWPHGVAISDQLLESGNTCLALAYHDDNNHNEFVPELFECKRLGEPWVISQIGDVTYNEDLSIADVNKDGKVEIISGSCWYEQVQPKVFKAHPYTKDFIGSRVVAVDINGNGLLDIIAGDETCDYDTRKTSFGKLVWFENPGKGSYGIWKMHIIDTIRSPHSISVADINGDGCLEVIAAEHDPFQPYRSRCRLFVYQNKDKKGLYWNRYTLDDRFEHHDGANLIELPSGEIAIVSHGWTDTQFVHIWK